MRDLIALPSAHRLALQRHGDPDAGGGRGAFRWICSCTGVGYWTPSADGADQAGIAHVWAQRDPVQDVQIVDIALFTDHGACMRIRDRLTGREIHLPIGPFTVTRVEE